MTVAVPSPTFRDPAGSLSFEETRVVRRIDESARVSVLAFLGSSFCQRAQGRGDLVAATIDDSAGALRLIHPRIPVPSYPWEWTPSQWLAAAELTLKLCEEALDEGWILKDATPLNVLFEGARPIFVDILSFEMRDPGTSIWLAYGQYVRTFLLPLIMHQKMSWPLSLTLFKRDGYEPLELYAALGWRQRLSRSAFWPIAVPALLEKRRADQLPAAAERRTDPEMATHILRRTLSGLRRRTRRALPVHRSSGWSEYRTSLSHYTHEESDQKREWVRSVLKDLRPERVLDIGANTGEYSALSSATGAQVIALERDQAAADRLFRMSSDKRESIQTIHADIARPTPAVGWDNLESLSLLQRLEGQCDLVLMLAVIHHLLLMEQIPLPAMITMCQRLTLRYLVIEWVPAEDPMYQSLMRGRQSLYGSLSEADLLAACLGRFEVLRQQTLGNGRVLFLFERCPSAQGMPDREIEGC